MGRLKKIAEAFDAKAANGHSAAINVKGYRHVMIVVGSPVSTDLDINLKTAIAESADDVDFTAAAGDTNLWAYAQMKDREDDASFNGNEGVTLAGKGVSIYEANTDGIDYVAFEVSEYAAGSVTIKVRGYDNS